MQDLKTFATFSALTSGRKLASRLGMFAGRQAKERARRKLQSGDFRALANKLAAAVGSAKEPTGDGCGVASEEQLRRLLKKSARKPRALVAQARAFAPCDRQQRVVAGGDGRRRAVCAATSTPWLPAAAVFLSFSLSASSVSLRILAGFIGYRSTLKTW